MANHGKQNVSNTLSMYPPSGGTSYDPPPPPPPPSYVSPDAQAPPFTTPSNGQYPPSSTPWTNQPPLPPGQHYYQGLNPSPNGFPSNQQQQQQQVIVVGSQPTVAAPVFVVSQPAVSMVGAIVLACITYWFCGWLFGGIAFILAMVGQSSAAAGDTRGAIQLRNASYGLSIAGIVIGVIVIAVVIGVTVSAAKAATYYTYSNYHYYYYYYYYGK